MYLEPELLEPELDEDDEDSFFGLGRPPGKKGFEKIKKILGFLSFMTS